MKYRGDIDGLRAISVSLVVLYHAGLGWVSGGFIGVDVFFVISGYLITGIIVTDIDHNAFSLIKFYDRRIRRIYPALMLVMLASIFIFSTILIPKDFVMLGKSLMSTSVYSSNIFFWLDSGYFSAAAQSKPLLHTWSLAIEEQFYVLFPVLLLALSRTTRERRSLCLWVIALLSLSIGVIGVAKMPSATFYLLPGRAWELLIGSLLAVGAIPQIRSPALRAAAGLAGLVLIIGSALLLTAQDPFPGLAALPPCLGAALILHAGSHGNGLSAKILSVGPVRFIGLISYSLYLWHWPIFAFLKYYHVDEVPQSNMVLAVLASVLVATLSWRYVETPFRNQAIIGRRAVFASAAGATAIVMALGLATIPWSGWERRFPPKAARLIAYTENFSPERQRCHHHADDLPDQGGWCVYGAKQAPATAVWGDSHAVELAYELGRIAGLHHQSVIHFSMSSCPPALGFSHQGHQACGPTNAAILGNIMASPDIRTVVLAAYYRVYLDDPDLADPFATGFRKTVAALLASGRRVVLVYPVPDQPSNVPIALGHYAMGGRSPALYGTSRANYLAHNRAAFALLDGLPPSDRLVRVYPHKLFCQADRCPAYRDPAALYFDDNHLSLAGAAILAADVWPAAASPAR